MRNFDENGLFICKYQASLFEKAKDITEFSSPEFIKKFMNSKYAEIVDSYSLPGNEETPEKILEELNKNYKSSNSKEYYEKDIMYWIGYVYRYWSYTYEISSKQVYKYISGTELFGLYKAYHTLDCSKVIERIMESKGIKQLSPLEIMRKIKGAK